MPMFDLWMNGDAHLWNQFPRLDGLPVDASSQARVAAWREMPLLCAGSSLAAESTR